MILGLVLAASSGFQVVPSGGSWWLRDPEGRLFLANGVCCVNRGLKPEEWNPHNPGFSSSRLFSSEGAWAKAAAKTLRDFGFNTVGAWSDHELLGQSGLYQTPVLHLSAAGIPWVDPWSEKAQKDAYEVARKQISSWETVPGVIGYFSDNELGWWWGALFEWTWKGEPGTPGRRKASAHLQKEYGTWENLLRDFDPEGAGSFEELADRGRLFLRPGGQGSGPVRRWLAQVADQYYALCRQIIKDLHPQALFLGDRYISSFYPEVAEAAGRHVDVLSTNLNADWPQGVFAPYYLNGLRELAKKPLMITEYYSAAMDNQSGNMNDSSGFPTLATQKERVASFRRQTEFLLRQPDVLGVHWFQYYDEPRHGRYDGENYNFGLVDIHGKPYRELARAGVRSLAQPALRRADQPNPRKSIPYVSPQKARRLADWPQWDAAMPRTSGAPRGDFYMAWNESGLYGAVYWNEGRFFEAFYREGKIPEADLATFELKVRGESLVKGALGAPGGPRLEGANILEHQDGVRSWVVFRIHASRLKQASLAAGDLLPFQAQLSTRARFYTLKWSADFAAEPKRTRS